jgi:protein ImuB
VYLDVAGLGGLFGDEEQIGRRLVRGAAERSRPVRVGIASSRVSALSACRRGGDVTVIPPEREAAYLAPAPLTLLDLSPQMAARLDRWGLRTLGDLAALPSAQLFERLGSEGLGLQRLARGDDPRPLRPWEPPLIFEESSQLDGAVETLPPLVELMARLADQISDRLVRGGLSADQLEWICHLADCTCHEGRIVPAFPVTEGREMTALVKAALEARPARSPVEAVTLRARPVRVPAVQALLEDPLRPSPRLITATLARVAALVGAEQVGVPRLLDRHSPDAVTLDHDAWPGQPSSRPRPAAVSAARAMLALRRIRPPVPATVTLVAGRPVELRSRGLAARIVVSAGPWRVSGEWWTERPWFRDEWDVELGVAPIASGQQILICRLCRLAHDGSAWWLDGIYD